MRKQTVKKYTKSDFERFMNTGKTPKGIHNGLTKIETHTHTDYKIEKGVPIPDSYHRLNHKYPLLLLEVGDSFTVPVGEAKHVRSAIGRIQRRNETFQFVTRTVHGRGRAGQQLRVWRVTV